MGTVRLEFLFSIARALGGERMTEDTILETKVEEGETVCTLLGHLAARYPRFAQIVFDAKSKSVSEEVSLFLNGRRLELLSGLETKLEDGDVLGLLPFISGG
jgi:MoaD family protein